jgi:hypothetical protein
MFHPSKEDDCGVIAGTTNHIASMDWIQLIIENSRIVQINQGGAFGAKLRDVMERMRDLQYPTFPGKGIMWWLDASIGTNPHIHRPRKDFPSGFVNCLYERVRSGVIHIGFGTIISSEVVAKVAGAVGKVLASGELRNALLERGAQSVPSTPAQLRTFVESELARWGDVVRSAGARIE